MKRAFRWFIGSVVAVVIVLMLGLAWASASSGTGQVAGAHIAQPQIRVKPLGPLAVVVECANVNLTPKVNHNMADDLDKRMVLTCAATADDKPLDVAYALQE